MKFQKSAAYEKRRVQWLWRPFIQRGAINLLTGGPGTGKSTITCDIAAALSVGRPLPGEDEATAKERGVLKTLMLNAEDDPNDTIVWRLDNQKADRDKIWLCELAEAVGKEQISDIFKLIRTEGIDLLTVDPVQAWIGQETDMYRPNHMRAWGNLFKNLCVETGVTVLWVRHRRKGDADDHNSINSGLGSIDLSGIVRSEIGAVATKKGAKITRIKGNVGQTNLEVSYSIQDTGEEGNDHGQLSWSSEIKKAKAEKEDGPTKRNPMDSWLIGLLAGGPKLAQEIIDAADRLGYKAGTVQRRAADLVVKFKEDGRAFWRLRRPDDEVNSDEDVAD